MNSSFISRASIWIGKLYQRDLILLPVIFIALLVRLFRPDLPGPYADEINWAELSLRMRQQNLDYISPDQHLYFLGRWWTLGMAPHTLGFPIYPIFVGLFLTNYLYVNRIINLIYGLLIIACVYVLAKDLFDRKTALISAVLLILMPTSLRYSRIDVIYLRALLGIALLAFYVRWYKTGRWIYFYAGSLMVGIGLSTRPEILWVVIALAGYLFLFNWQAIRRILDLIKHSLLNLFVGLISLSLGASIFIAYNLISGGGTIKFFLSLAPTQSMGNLSVFEALARNFNYRLFNLKELLTGRVPFIGVPYLTVAGNDLYVTLFYAAFIIFSLIILLKRIRKQPDRSLEFLLVIFSLIFIESMATTSGYAAVHLLYLFPLLPMMISRLISINWLGLKGEVIASIRTVLAIVVLVSLVYNDISADLDYYRLLDKTGGVGTQSLGVFDLANYLETQDHTEVITCDWGLSNILYFVTRGKVDATQIFGYTNPTPPEFYTQIGEKLGEPKNIYIFYDSQFAQFKRREDFVRYLTDNGYTYTQTTLSDKNGPLYIVYSNVVKENQGTHSSPSAKQ